MPPIAADDPSDPADMRRQTLRRPAGSDGYSGVQDEPPPGMARPVPVHDLVTLAGTIFVGERQHLADWFQVGVPPPGAIACVSLGEEAVLLPLLEVYRGQTYPADDGRAAASLWSQWYFGLLLSPLLLLSAAAGCEGLGAAADIAMVPHATGRPERFVLTRTQSLPSAVEPAAWRRHAALIDGHLAPLIDALARAADLAPRLLWSNAAVAIDFVGSMLTGTGAAQIADLCQAPCRPDGARNPLHRPFGARQEAAGERLRRICCLRYRLEGVERCGTCPVADRPDVGPAVPAKA
ncbi:siderophore-iron reductase FhuF [Aurantimonas sp. MSK8Z-1]|uniref:siderophore-iron reductase FhuF n=1 Tax=Mangrovibrevibacter kandeliae TaxID=2968473 RepID=UPI0021188D32|nr:siderophore-iron reductase FhuF [Aurantimonas sp. MSK8Z-1]MCW4116163.1 siderophore-iron reductase FhuF [Aurantimonas sp. MSK8Z-1]